MTSKIHAALCLLCLMSLTACDRPIDGNMSLYAVCSGPNIYIDQNGQRWWSYFPPRVGEHEAVPIEPTVKITNVCR